MSNKKILIVEDDRDVRLGYHIRLKANHYDTFFATDSLTSISEARKHQPDLIILDLGLPAGDGFVVMERLQGGHESRCDSRNRCDRRVDPYPNRETALLAGAKAFLQKPVDNKELLAVIRKYVGEPNEPR